MGHVGRHAVARERPEGPWEYLDGRRRFEAEEASALGEPGKGPSWVGVAMLAAPSSTFMAKLSHGSTSTEEAGEDIARRVVQLQGPKTCVDGYGSRSAFSYDYYVSPRHAN